MNGYERLWAVFWVSCAAIVLGITAAIFFGTQRSDQRYQELARSCIEAGGSWVNQMGYDGTCVGGRQ